MNCKQTCSLCGVDAVLCESHLVPQFASDWLKKQSATKYLREAKSPNVRRQDTRKERLLCTACEGRFAVWEHVFSEIIFKPIHTGTFKRLQYDDWLYKFAVSLSWRTLFVNAKKIREKNPEFAKVTDSALVAWRDCLLEKRKNSTPFEHHIFIMDLPDKVNVPRLPKKFLWYLLGSIDATFACGKRTAFVYVKLIRTMFISPLTPLHPSGLIRTRISPGPASLVAPQEIQMPGFMDFLVERAREVLESKRLSERQLRKIADSISKLKPEELAESESLRIWMAQNALNSRVQIKENESVPERIRPEETEIPPTEDPNATE